MTVLEAEREALDELLTQPCGPYEPTMGPGDRLVSPAGDPLMFVERVDGPEWAELREALVEFPCGPGVVRSAGVRNRAQVFGYLGSNGVLRRIACTCAAPAWEAPREHAIICAAAQWIAERLEAVAPDVAERQRATCSVVDEAWRLPGGMWTSGVVNRDSVLPYHYDRNNFTGSWSAMVVGRRFARGGHLHLPEYGQTVECEDGALILFPGPEVIHGVTPLRIMRPEGYRISAVYYAVKRMAKCLPPDEQWLALGERRSELTDTLMERQRAGGSLDDGR